ncbi:unnamed protein product [Lactuca saligna]|uniref:Kinesin motor domain-containing protein n=1 Tax=Lactuca saligna TaxID=75948 RepID=A0AA35YSY8_LACSI|nr:unnamed protein product [Lactuca saligna]
MQELTVIDDLLSALVGIEGPYISINRVGGNDNSIIFNVDGSMDLALQGAANIKVAGINMNNKSSRSHSVFTCWFSKITNTNFLQTTEDLEFKWVIEGDGCKLDSGTLSLPTLEFNWVIEGGRGRRRTIGNTAYPDMPNGSLETTNTPITLPPQMTDVVFEVPLSVVPSTSLATVTPSVTTHIPIPILNNITPPLFPNNVGPNPPISPYIPLFFTNASGLNNVNYSFLSPPTIRMPSLTEPTNNAVNDPSIVFQAQNHPPLVTGAMPAPPFMPYQQNPVAHTFPTPF